MCGGRLSSAEEKLITIYKYLKVVNTKVGEELLHRGLIKKNQMKL
jgi:hypothetical protein